MHETEFVLVRDAPQDTSGILSHNVGSARVDINDPESVWLAQNEESQRVIVYPQVITDRLDLFQNQ